MEKVRIGIIGCGGIANGKHMPSLHQLDNVEMVAFCDLIEERAVAAKQKYGTPDAKVYTNYKELLEDKSINVVHVCTPNRSHSFITVDALEAGKDVMCEKPMAINSAEAKKMVDAAKRTGRLLTIGYQSRQRADSQYLKHEVEAGTLGEIYYAKATAIRRRQVPTWGVFLNEYEQGGGSLIDIGTHSLDLTLWMMNNYKPKMCIGTTYHKLGKLPVDLQGNGWGPWDPDKMTVEDSAFGLVVMENGATVLVESSWALNYANPIEAVTTLCGTLGGADMKDGLRFNGVKNGRLFLNKVDMTTGGAAFYEGHANEEPQVAEARQWINAVINRTNPCVLPEQAYCVTRILEGIYVSSQTGKAFYFDN